MANLTKLRDEFAACSDFMIALGDEKRQAIIIRLLEEKACNGVRVIDLMDATDLSRPAVSHHLKVLKDAQLVTYRSEGTKNYYYLTHQTTAINQLRHLLDNVLSIMKKEPAK